MGRVKVFSSSVGTWEEAAAAGPKVLEGSISNGVGKYKWYHSGWLTHESSICGHGVM